jgi:hypothetical protein
LGAIPRRIKRHPFGQGGLILLGQHSLRQPTTDHKASGSAQWFVGGFAFEAIFEEVDHLREQARYSTKKKSRLRTEKSAKSYDWASEKCARSPEGFALKIQSGMLRNIQE